MQINTESGDVPANSAASRARRIAEAQLRRTLLLHADAAMQLGDQIECTELALAADRPEFAQLLYDLTCVRFGPDAMPRQGALARLWGVDISRSTVHGVEGAITELKTLIASQLLPPLPQNPTDLFVDTMEARPADAIMPELEQNVAEAVTNLCDLLHAPGNDATLAQLDALLTTLEPLSIWAPINLRDHVDNDMEKLASVSALRGLQAFLQANRALAFAPFGSAALLHATARLGSAALGAYMGNFTHLVRDSSDLLGILSAAAPVMTDEERARWIALLAANLRIDHLLELVDDLADLSMGRALWTLLAANLHRASTANGPILLARIRDAALDNGDFELAERAQALAASALVNDVAAWRILGDIRATMGDEAEAETAFVHCLGYAPHNRQILARLDALRGDRFQQFAVIGGIDTLFSVKTRRIARWDPDRILQRPPVATRT